jgi:uncharacterized protein (DUF1015 family)
VLFAYPKQAAVGRAVPKTKIYEHARITKKLRQKFVDQIASIRWAYKLSTESVNLPATGLVPEIEIFVIELKGDEISSDVVRCIDTAIPFPIIYEFIANDRVKLMAAYKRPSEGDKNKWVTDIYFESKWHKINAKRTPLPVALDLGLLYEQMLRSLMPVSSIDGEDIRDQVGRLTEVRSLETQAAKIESRLRKEKQFNRRVELNADLRGIRKKIDALI